MRLAILRTVVQGAEEGTVVGELQAKLDLDWLKKQGVTVERFNLSSQPAAFAETVAVKNALERGTDVLPLVLVDDRIAVEGSYPSRDTLAALAGVVVRKLEAAPASSGCCGPSTSGKKTSCC